MNARINPSIYANSEITWGRLIMWMNMMQSLNCPEYPVAYSSRIDGLLWLMD